MHFHVANIGRVGVAMAQNPFEERELIALVRPRNRHGLAAMVGAGPGDDAEDWIIIRLSIFQSLQHDCSHSVGAAISIGRVIEGIAVARRRQEMPAVEADKVIWVGEHIGAARDGRVAFALP